jgi:uncharacterized coiled-coil DUF342 family protein
MSAEEDEAEAWARLDELRRAEERLLHKELAQLRAELLEVRTSRDQWRDSWAQVARERDQALASAAHYRARCAALRRERRDLLMRRGWAALERGVCEDER